MYRKYQKSNNPFLATIENLQKFSTFSIPFDGRYSYENRDSFIPRKYPAKITSTTPSPPSIDEYQIGKKKQNLFKKKN